MDDRRFDALTKAIGLRTSRRSLLRGAIGALMAGVTGALTASERARAAVPKRPRTCIQVGRSCGSPAAGASRGCCYKCDSSTNTCCETVRYGCTTDGDCCGALICRDQISGDADPQRTCFQPGTLPGGAECRAASECAAGGCANGRCCAPENAACSANSQCCNGLVCRGGTCRPRGTHGQTCDESADCQTGLGCQNGSCCGLNQTACASNSQCCSGLVCRGGICQLRGATGQVCDEHADCQSNACDPNRQVCCQPGGKTCSANSQCCSGTVCRGGVCQAPGQTGQVCDEPADCANGNCDATRRVCCVPASAACTINSQCCGGNVCRGGTCQAAGGQGATCDEPADCRAGYTCQSAACCAQQSTTCSANRQCCAGLVCRGGACLPPGTGGQVCDEDDDCAAGTCNSGVCCVAGGAACTTNGQCCGTLVCRNGTCQAPGELGEICDEAADCSTGACDGSRRICCRPATQACSVNADCCDALVCRGGTCRALGTTGQTCDEGIDCVSGTCHATNSVCCLPQDQGCTANAQCCDGLVCRDGACRPPGAGGDICDEDADCATGTCTAGVCCLPATSACTANSQCCSGLVCRGGTCQAAGALGEVCDEGPDCTSVNCDSTRLICCLPSTQVCTANGDCCGPLVCRGGTCQPLGVSGDVCDFADGDADCASGFVCQIDTCCASQTTNCTANSQCCQNLVCRGGVCDTAGLTGDVCDTADGNLDCGAGHTCENGQCCLVSGRFCSADDGCCSGLSCIGGFCLPQSGIGGSCDSDGDCSAGTCNSGVCCVADSAACTLDGDCCAGLVCSGAICTTPAPPVANTDHYSTLWDTPLVVPAADGVLANDTTQTGTLSVTASNPSTAAGGTVAVAPNGSFTYTPPVSYYGPDSFTYTVTGDGGNDVGTVSIFVEGDYQLLGEIRMFALDYAPRGWLLCHGQLLPINQHTALFSLIGTTYGGNGTTTFGLPDLRGRVPMHTGGGHSLGEQSGVESITLLTSQLPVHTHTVNGTNDPADLADPSGALPAQATAQIYNGALAPLAALHSSSVTSAGSSQAHSNMQPFLAINFCIAYEGIFPSRP